MLHCCCRNPDHAPAGAQETEVIDLLAKHLEINPEVQAALAQEGAGG